MSVNYNAEELVKNIPGDVFLEGFVRKLGITHEFSKLCSSELSRMTAEDWSEIIRGYEALGIKDASTMSNEKKKTIAFAMAARCQAGEF